VKINKYEWLAYETAPEGYSAEVWHGFLSNDEGRGFLMAVKLLVLGAHVEA
jgi:hypothetical protein